MCSLIAGVNSVKLGLLCTSKSVEYIPSFNCDKLVSEIKHFCAEINTFVKSSMYHKRLHILMIMRIMAYVSTPLEIFNSQMDHMTIRYRDALELGRQYTYTHYPVFKNIATCSFIVPQLGKACWLNTHLNS